MYTPGLHSVVLLVAYVCHRQTCLCNLPLASADTHDNAHSPTIPHFVFLSYSNSPLPPLITHVPSSIPCLHYELTELFVPLLGWVTVGLELTSSNFNPKVYASLFEKDESLLLPFDEKIE